MQRPRGRDALDAFEDWEKAWVGRGRETRKEASEGLPGSKLRLWAPGDLS